MVFNPSLFNPKWHVAHKIAELGLIGTEVAEAIEEVRNGRAMTEVYHSTKDALGNKVIVAEEDLASFSLPAKPEGVPSELADVIIRVLDIADAYGIDIGAAVVEKLNHNATRGKRHGGKAL
jgi:NTP pyrophosphatase (non-canonical NTP hydrolase)